MAKNRVQVFHEACPGRNRGDWALALQWAMYAYEDGEMEYGYRFIWRRADDSLQAARGQARIPSMRKLKQLIKIAESEGWGNYDSDKPPWTLLGEKI